MKQYLLSKLVDVAIEMLITSVSGGIGVGQYTMINSVIISLLQGLH